MKYFIILSLSIINLFNHSCSTSCPDDEKIGDIALSEQSLAYFPYEDGQELVFKNTSGEEFLFVTNGVQTESTQLSVYKICTEVKYDGQSTYKYFEGQSKNVFFTNTTNNFGIGIGVYTEVLRPEQELFYDKLVMNVSSVGEVGRGELVTDIRFDEAYEESEFNIDSPMEFVATVDLNGTTYHDVYTSEVYYETNQIFYTKNQGIIGFIHDGITYNLDRID